MGKCKCMYFSPIALGFAVGIVSGLCMMILAWLSWSYGFGSFIVQQKAAIFPGYEASFIGGFYGLAWGILTGFVCGLVLAIVYNICLCCSSCRCCCCKTNTAV